MDQFGASVVFGQSAGNSPAARGCRSFSSFRGSGRRENSQARAGESYLPKTMRPALF